MKPTADKRPPLLFLFLSALTLSLLGYPAHGTTVALLTLDETLQQSELIVEATVVAIESRWSQDRTMIHTYVTFDDLDVIAGRFDQSELTLRFEGGEIGDHRVTTFGVPNFQEGSREILMVRDNGIAASPVVGLFQGRFRVVDSLVHDYGGRPIVSVNDGTLYKLNSRAPTIGSSNSEGISAGTPEGNEDYLAGTDEELELRSRQIVNQEALGFFPEEDPAPVEGDETGFSEATDAPQEVAPGVVAVKTSNQKSYPRYIAESRDPGTRLTTDEFAGYIKSRLAHLRSQAARSDR